MNNIEAAKETIKITESGVYEVSGKKIRFDAEKYRGVVVYSPEAGQELLNKAGSFMSQGEMCKISVVNSDSFEAAKDLHDPCVMNFANAHNPGGGFKLGANTQEEALCRCSTLYASISSSDASEMYRYNNTHIGMVESDYMLLSKKVLVFRSADLKLLTNPFTVGVITVPAPNRRCAALFASSKLVEETMIRRIRILLLIAADNGYKSLVLGAWGCGAFGNKPEDVAGFFRQVLVDEGYGRLFDEVRFAIYGAENGKNITAFRRVMAGKRKVTAEERQRLLEHPELVMFSVKSGPLTAIRNILPVLACAVVIICLSAAVVYTPFAESHPVIAYTLMILIMCILIGASVPAVAKLSRHMDKKAQDSHYAGLLRRKLPKDLFCSVVTIQYTVPQSGEGAYTEDGKKHEFGYCRYRNAFPFDPGTKVALVTDHKGFSAFVRYDELTGSLFVS